VYTCPHCGNKLDLRSFNENKCPECRYRILFKDVPSVKKSINSSGLYE
jgi:DNA-directed RNA polymerase subunit P